MNIRNGYLTLAVLVIAACSELENPVDSNVPIALTYSTVNAVETRAAQDLNQGSFASGESVKVRISNTGENSWTDYTFTTGENGTMTPAGSTPYYPAGDQRIDITACYPATAGTSFTVASDQTSDASYKASDLMFASVSNQAKTSEAVNLAFSHKMAKFCVNITAGEGVTSISSVSILNVKPTVSLNQVTGEVGVATGDATTIAMSNNGAALIPAQTIDGDMLSIVTDRGTAIYSVSNKNIVVGNQYTLNITVNLCAVGATTEITGWTSEGTVTVNPVVHVVDIPDCSPAGAEAVDLGLSVKWANMNIGATTVTGRGTFFAWGETKGYTDENHYDKALSGFESNYWWGTTNSYTKYNSADQKTRLDADNDAAHYQWGGSWRMPTREEVIELATSSAITSRVWTDDYNSTGVKGFVITATNGNSIFLPLTGYLSLDISNVSYGGFYWSSDLDPDPNHSNRYGWPNMYSFSRKDKENIDYSDFALRSYGLCVRAVRD